MARNWAITIGINDYDNLQSLRFAKRDAEAMRHFCLEEAQFQEVYHFSDDSPDIPTDSAPIKSRPTYATLKRFLRVRFDQPFLTTGDNLWFFFAGHGKRFEDRDYLMPIDADPGNVDETALSMHFITERLRRCGADNVILFIDACRDEGRRDGSGIGVEKQQGVVTLYSCSPKESSYEIEPLQQGAFTHALLEGLRIQGEGNCATVERLSHYLRYQVPLINQRYGKPRQTPYPVTEPASKLHLILLPKLATVADVMALKNDAFEAEAEGRWELSEQLWVRVLSVSPADPQAINAIKRLARLQGGVTSQATIVQEVAIGQFQGDDRSGGKKDDAALETTDLDELKQQLERQRQEAKLRKAQMQVDLEIQSIEANLLQSQQRYEMEKKVLEAQADGYLSALEGADTLVGTGAVSENSETLSDQESPLQHLTLSTFEFEVVTVDERGKEIGRKRQQAECWNEDLGDDVSLEMVRIPGGSFLMGSSNDELERYKRESPQHLVTVPTFLVAKYPITQAQWETVACMQKVKSGLAFDPSRVEGNDHPVERVSWHEAVEFCRRLANFTGRPYRLPTEAEWEYACRAGATTPFHFGETITTDLANYRGTDHERLGSGSYRQGPKGVWREETTPVGSFGIANAFGLYDMHGNVWEWCEDHWHDNYEGAPTDGSAWLYPEAGEDASRVLRGGSWFNLPDDCRSATRINHLAQVHLVFDGFRVVCSLPRVLQ